MVLGILLINAFTATLLIKPILAPSSWWNANWQYRMQINITSTQALTDYPVLVTVDTESLIPSKMQSDGSDIRFMTQNFPTG